MENQIIFDTLPSGLKTRSGGTRRLIQQRLSRPWQKEQTTPENCPLCTTTEAFIVSPPGWRVFRNPSINYAQALLIVPEICSSDLESICRHWEQGLGVVNVALANMSRQDTWLGIQVGGLAGGSVDHAHYHLIEPDGLGCAGVAKTADFFIRERERFLNPILVLGQCVAYAGGSRAGQCIILSADNSLVPHQDVGSAIAAVLRLYAEKFRSQEGLAPEYQVGVAFADRQIRYATVVPILTQPGFADHLAILEGREISLGWPHEETARFLTSE